MATSFNKNRCGMNRKPVASLADLSQKKITDMIIQPLISVGDYRDPAAAEWTTISIREYMISSGTTGHVNEALLSDIMPNDKYSSTVRLFALKALLIQSVTRLSTGTFIRPHDLQVFQTILEHGSGLTVLNLNEIWTLDMYLHYVCQIVAKCKLLKKLYIQSIGTDEILISIAEHSPHLSILNISGRTDITEIGLDALSTGCCYKNLTMVDIGIPDERDICYTDVALILERCPNIKSLGSYSYVGLALVYITENISRSFKCNLEYVRDSNTDDAALETIMFCCPKISSLYMRAPLIDHHQTLENVKFHEFIICETRIDVIVKFLKVLGWGLEQLYLINIDSNISLETVLDLTPKLKSLTCNHSNYVAFPWTDKTYNIEEFKMQDCDYETEDFKIFLCHLPKIVTLDIDAVDFNNDDIVTIFCKNSLKNLQTLFFRRAHNLTSLSFEILKDNCPQLKQIGMTSGWNIPFEEIAYLKCIIKSGNFDIELKW